MKSAAYIYAYRSLRGIVEFNPTRLGRAVKKGISVAICLCLLTSNLAYAKAAIEADGKTQTIISQDGFVTNISTDTVLNQNAFNSFSRFNVDSGHTVNLYIPSGAANLLNLVHSERSSIDGVLNSIKNGQIGGNVFFLNPYGLIVGSEGTLNVGSLTAISPTTGFMENFFDSPNNPSPSAVDGVLAGEVPLNESGLITINGTVNAIGDIRLSSRDVENTGIITSRAVFAGTSPDFSDIVNIAGLASGSAMTTENGSIVITAHNDVKNSGIIASYGGDVTLAGGRIEITDGALIDAQGSLTGGDGDISLAAARSDHVILREANADTGIYIANAELKGKDISLTASADAQYELEGLASVVLKNVDNEIGYDLDAEVVLAEAAAASEIVLGIGSVLEASGNVALHADAAATAKTEVKDKGTERLSISFLYGEIDSKATVDVQDGAQITASNLSIRAKNQATLDASIESISLEGESVETAIAVTKADVNALAKVAAGAQLNITNDLSIAALNTNDFATSAEAKANKDGLAGIAAVYFTANTQASAVSDADLTGLKNLTIDALDNTIKNTTSASSETGGEESYQKAMGYVAKGAEFIENKFGEKAPELDEKSGNTGGLQAAGTVSIVQTDQRSLAKIGDYAEVSVQNDVVVNAQTRNAGLQNKAVSNVEAEEDSDAATALSAAMAYGDYKRNAEAYLGTGSHVQAQRVGIGSQIVMPYIELHKYGIQWGKLTSLSTISDELAKLKDLAGNPLLTSYANATETDASVGVAGSLSYTSFHNNSSAYLGKGARITLLQGTNEEWEKTLPSEATIKWHAPLSIAASTDHTGVYAAGNFSFSLKGTGGKPGSASAGGAYNQVNHNSNTRAYVAAGAEIIQAGPELQDISITADTKELVIALGPTSGQGGSMGLNGIFSMTKINSNTEASISDKASIVAKKLLLNAKEDVVSWAVTGAINLSESAGVGVAIAVNDITTDTKAYIGPNSEDGEGLDPGSIRTESLLVNALTDGRIEAVSVAGVMASSEDPGEQPSEGFLSKVKGKLTNGLKKLVGKTEEPEEAAKLDPASQVEKTEPKFGLAISGSSAVNLGGLNTKAYVVDGTVELTGGQRPLAIRAINNSQVLATSGAAALSRAKNPSSQFSVGIAGSMACNDLLNKTAAEMINTDVAGASQVAVQALAGGQQVAVALGLGVNASADQDTAASAAGSVSVNTVTNLVTATVQDSELAGQDGGSNRHLDITAYDRTKVGTGGGSLIAGGKAGLGAAITYSEIDGTAGAYLSGTQISGFDLLQVHGLTASLIGSAGAMGGYTIGDESGTFGGVVAINKIDRHTEAVVDGAAITGGDIDILAKDVNAATSLDSLIDEGEEQLADELDYTGSEVFTDDTGLAGTSIISVAGVAQASGNNVGISFAWNEISNDFRALVKDSKITTSGDVGVQASANTMIAGLSVGASYASGRFSGAASVTANEIGSLQSEGNSVSAQVLDSDIEAASLSILAQDNSLIWSLAGQITAGAKASLGGAIAHNMINNSVQARLTGGMVTLDESLLLKASNDSTIRTLAVAGGGSEEFAFNGSVTSAHISNDTIAAIEDTEESDDKTVVDAQAVVVKAEDNSEINALSGAFSGSGSAAVGGAISVNTIGNNVIARIGQSSLALGNSLTVGALNSAIIRTLAAAAGGAESAAISGSLTESNIFNTTEAEMVNTDLVGAATTTPKTINIRAQDASEIHALSGGVSGSGTAAVAGAATVNTVTNTTRAKIEGGLVTGGNALTLEALNTSTIKAASAAGEGAGTAAVGGSSTISIIRNSTAAELVNTSIGDITDDSADSVRVTAKDASSIQVLAGNVGLSGTAAVGGAISANVVANTTGARITGSQVSADDSTLVQADNQSKIETVSVSGAGSGTAAVTGSVAASHIANTTEAEIIGSSIRNDSNHVSVLAADDSQISSISGGAAASGTASVGAAVSINRIANTTTARVGGGNLEVEGLLVKGRTNSNIESLAVGLGGSGVVAVAGSTAINLIHSDTAGYIDSGANITAQNNVGVLAETNDVVTNRAGTAGIGVGGVGVGASVTVNQISGSTKAYISGSNTRVTALAQDETEKLTVAEGGLQEDIDLGAGLDLGKYTRPELANLRKTEEVSGIAVVASGTHSVENVVANAGIGAYAGVAGTTNTSVISGTTEAYVDQATINNKLGTSGQALHIQASDHAYSHGFVGSVGAGIAGIGMGIDTAVFSNSTRAYIKNANPVRAQGLVEIDAQSTQGASSLATSGAGGIVGVAGTGTVGIFKGTTEAYLQSAPIRAGGLVVKAQHDSRLFVAAGSAGIGGAAVGGAFTVAVDHSITKAYVADTTVNTAGTVDVEADNNSEIRNRTASGSGGGSAGIAGSALVSIIGNTTQAYITNSQLGQDSSRVGGVSVQAQDRVLSENKAGAVGLGVTGAGVGAGAAVTLVDNTTSAYVEGSSVYTKDTLLVAAVAERDLSTTVVSAGVGAGAGLGGTAVVTLVGRALSGDVVRELDKNGTGTLTELESFTNNDRLKTGEEEGNAETGQEIDLTGYDPGTTVTGGLTEAELASLNTAGKASVTGSLNSNDLRYQTSALVKDSSISAERNVQITAAEKVKVDIDSGAVGAGLGLGIGGSVGVLDLVTSVRAEVLGTTTITAEEGTIEIAADTSSLDGGAAVNVNAYQGSAGIAALGAAVSTARVTNDVTARVGQGSVLHTSSDSANQGLVVQAHDRMAVNTKAYGAAVGLAAAGVVSATAEKAGNVLALVDNQTEVNLVSGDVNIRSSREGQTSAYSLAGAGGVHAGNASVAQAKETGLVQASIGQGVTITAPDGAVRVEALSKPQVAADSLGYGGAIFSALGLSLADAVADTKIRATIGTGGKIKADSLIVNALTRLAGTSPTVRSYAEAIGGGALLGANAANSVAKSSLVVTASLGSNLAIAHDVQVLASNTTRQEAKVTGIVGGLAAAGANLATAEANSTVTALAGNGATGTVGGTLVVNAVGSDDTYSEATSGSGGVVAGAAALAKTSNRSNTLAELGTAAHLLTAGKIALHARHAALFNGQSDSINASVVGASGAKTLHNVNAVVAAKIREEAELETFDLKATAENIVRKGWLSGDRFNVNAGSGGFLNGAAALSESDINNNTEVTIGARSNIRVVSNGGNPGRTDFTAINDIEARDKTRLDAGGAIAIALAKSRINVGSSNAQVRMGDGTSIDAVGNVNFSSRTCADLETSANAKAYGLAGAAQGASRSDIASDNSVVVGDAALIRAGGNINFYAGRDETGYMNTMRSIARTDLFNKTAVPIGTDPIADAVITQRNWIATGQGSLIRSVRDVSFITSKGSAVADGHGVGKDLYRQLAEDIGNAFSDLVGGGEVSLDIQSGSSTEHSTTSVRVDSRIDTGIHNQQRLIIDRDGNLADMTEGVNYYVTEEDVITNMFARLEYLANMRAVYANDNAAAAAYDSEINYIKQELLSLGYAEQHGDYIVPVKNLKARYINVGDVEARGGNVHVEADALIGTGHLLAPNDTSITIINNSMYFLRVNDLVIDPTGGHVYFNKVAVSSADDINERNLPGSPNAHLNVVAAGSSSATPTVVVSNTYSAPGNDFVPPDIELVGDIVNRTGSVAITNAQGSIKLLGQDGKAAPSITADTLTLEAGQSIVQSYVDGFQHIGGDPCSIWRDVQDGSERNRTNTHNDSYKAGTGSWIAGNNIFLSARYLNINGTIQSGIPDWAVTLGGSLDSTMDAYYNDWVRRGRPSMSNHHNLSLYKLAGNNTGEIAAYYNPELDRIVLDGVKVQGGYIELYGQIMNTGGGNIKVMDGYGRIDIDNMTSRDIVINGIDTGRIDGLVRITDTGRMSDGKPIITEYTRSGGNVYKSEYTKSDNADRNTTTSSGRNSAYNPASGLRYVWMRGQDFMVTYIGISEQKSTFWGALPISEKEYDEWTKTATGELSDLPDGVFTDGRGQNHNYQYYFQNYATSGLRRVSREEWVTYHWADIIKSTPTYHLRDTWKQGTQDIHVHSLKAGHTIPVEFIGYDEGRVDVDSNGSILLAGAVRNLVGDVSLRTDSSILRLTDGAVITGNDISLSAGSGIGDNLTGVAVQLQGDGSLKATTNQGDISIYGPTGDLRLDTISAANGNVHINADLDIVQASQGTSPVIMGSRINLLSRAGGIGTAEQAVNVQVGNKELSGLNATSPGDISIRQSSGDLRLVRVESLAGDVTLEVASGSMIDANPEEKKDTRVIEELERLWDDMMLTEDTAGSSSEATLKAYRQAKEAEYQDYWRMRNVQPIFDEEGNVAGYTFDTYDPSHPDAEYQQLHEKYGDTQYDAAWQYTIGDEERAALTEGSVWTAKELETSLSRGLLFKQTTSTETRIKDPNVKGHNITLRALNGSVGTDNGEIVIDGSNPDELKDQQKRIALAAAEADDVAVDNDNKTITVLLRKPVNIAASGNIDVEAKDNVYLGSREPIYVKTVQTGESIRIKGTDGIYTVSTSGPAAIQGGRTILEGGDGGLGTAEAPLTLALKAGAELTARAAKDIHIQETVGSLNLAEVFGRGNVVLQAKESIFDSRGERSIAIMGNGVNLTAEKGSIGTEANPLYLTVNPSGQLTAYALRGDVYLATPSTNLVNLGDISAGGTLAVAAAGQLSIHGTLVAAEVLSIFSNGTLQVESSGRLDGRGRLTLMCGDVLMAEGSSGESADGIDIIAANGVEVSRLEADNDVQIAAGTTITQAGNGSITAQTLRTTSGGRQMLDGANRIASFAAANTGGGDIKLNNMSALSITGITQAAGGDIDVTNAGNLQISGTVSTADQVELSAAGGIVEGAAGRIHAERLVTSSIGGQVLLGDNRLRSFQASNQGDDIELSNNGYDLEVISINQADGGDIVLTNNEGGITITGLVRTWDGIDLTARGTIEQAGEGRIEEAASLTTASIGGQKLSGANTVHSFQGTNAGGGKVELDNTASSLEIIGIAQADGGEIELTNTGELEISGAISTAGQVELDATGKIAEGATGKVHAERLVTCSVGGQVLLGDNRIQSFQASNQGDDIQLNNNGYDLEVISINQVDGGDVVLTNNEGGITITGLVRTWDGIDLTARGTIEQAGEGRIEEAALLTTASIGGQKLLGANTVHSFQGTNAGGGKVELDNTASSLEIIGIAQAAGGDIELTNVGDVAISGQISSITGEISVAADGTIHSTHGDVSIRGKDINLEAKEGGIGSKEMRIVAVADGRTNLSAGLDIFFEERETDLDSDFIISEHGSVDLLVPAGGIHVDELRAAGSITVRTPRSVSLGSTAASQLNLYVSGINAGVSVAEALIAERLTVSADYIEFGNLIHTGVEPLQVSMGGGSKRMANSITVSGRSRVGMVFDLLESDTIMVNADTEDLKFNEIVLGTKAKFRNRYHTVIADNVNKQLFPCDVQLYPESDPFYLIMGRDRLIWTDAWVVGYHDDYIINDFATENSFMRITSKMPQIVGGGLRPDIGFSSSTLGRDDATGSSNIIISSGIHDSLQPGSSRHDDDDEERLVQ